MRRNAVEDRMCPLAEPREPSTHPADQVAPPYPLWYAPQSARGSLRRAAGPNQMPLQSGNRPFCPTIFWIGESTSRYLPGGRREQ